MEVAILGAGVAGIAAYYLGELGISATIYEQEETYGGLCNSFRIEGFTFDTFAHISFDPNTMQWMEAQTDFLVHRPEALNYAEGTWLRHPVQMNLYGLPVNDRIKVLKDFIYKNAVEKPSNYGVVKRDVWRIFCGEISISLYSEVLDRGTRTVGNKMHNRQNV